jgi:hypothetical protein
MLTLIGDAHGQYDLVIAAGRALRDEVQSAMAFVPQDVGRLDIHG